jgi:hypothetical protein
MATGPQWNVLVYSGLIRLHTCLVQLIHSSHNNQHSCTTAKGHLQWSHCPIIYNPMISGLLALLTCLSHLFPPNINVAKGKDGCVFWETLRKPGGLLCPQAPFLSLSPQYLSTISTSIPLFFLHSEAPSQLPLLKT